MEKVLLILLTTFSFCGMLYGVGLSVYYKTHKDDSIGTTFSMIFAGMTGIVFFAIVSIYVSGNFADMAHWISQTCN